MYNGAIFLCQENLIMSILNRPQIIDDAALASMTRKKIEKGRKPGFNIVIEILIFFLLFLLSSFCDAAAYMFAWLPAQALQNRNPDIETIFGISFTDYDLITSLFTTGVSTVFFIFVGYFFFHRKIRTFGFVKKNALKHYLIGLLAGGVLFAACVGICVVTGSATVNLSAEGIKPFPFILLIIGWLIQGNSEEVICRGYLLVSASRRYHVIVGILVNSILFACMHLANDGIGILPLINLALFGIVESLIFVRTGNIWLCSALHSAWNFVQGNVFGVLVSGGDMGESVFTTVGDPSKSLINGGDFGLEGGLAVTIVYVIAAIILLFFVKPSKS